VKTDPSKYPKNGQKASVSRDFLGSDVCGRKKESFRNPTVLRGTLKAPSSKRKTWVLEISFVPKNQIRKTPASKPGCLKGPGIVCTPNPPV